LSEQKRSRDLIFWLKSLISLERFDQPAFFQDLLQGNSNEMFFEPFDPFISAVARRHLHLA
jgi:hypothetical protein